MATHGMAGQICVLSLLGILLLDNLGSAIHILISQNTISHRATLWYYRTIFLVKFNFLSNVFKLKARSKPREYTLVNDDDPKKDKKHNRRQTCSSKDNICYFEYLCECSHKTFIAMQTFSLLVKAIDDFFLVILVFSYLVFYPTCQLHQRIYLNGQIWTSSVPCFCFKVVPYI